jgi:hypothetical protein
VVLLLSLRILKRPYNLSKINLVVALGDVCDELIRPW